MPRVIHTPRMAAIAVILALWALCGGCASTSELRQAQEANEALTQQLANERAAHIETTNKMDTAQAAVAALEAEVAALTQDTAILREQLAAQTAVAALVSDVNATTKELTTLRARVAEERAELARIEKLLDPLRLRSNQGRSVRFACSGSMTPVLTCAHTATAFKPTSTPLPKGAIIAYQGQDCVAIRARDHALTHNYTIAHRVIATMTHNGELHYYPKGDANRFPDGCWVPHSKVVAYIGEIRLR